MKANFFLFGLLFVFSINAQVDDKGSISNYLEDQFYFGLGINFLTNRPENVVQNSLSYNLQLGFIKDIPLNRTRNFGFGLVLGYAVNSYYSNIGANNDDAQIAYALLESDAFERNKLETHAVEVPLEVRWRTSTATDYRFWRIYAGLRFAYIFAGSSKLVTEGGTTRFSNGDIRRFQYGPTLSFGYNTLNIHAYYGINSLLDENVVLDSGAAIDTRVLRIGVIFYIL